MNALLALRYQRGLTQQEVARGAGIGRQTLHRLENGFVDRPQARVVKALADFYEIAEPAELLQELEGAA